MTATLPQRFIGPTLVSPMAIGTWSWGDTRQWGYAEEKDLPGIKEAWNVSLPKGITFYDTAVSASTHEAEVYGNGESERILGNLMRNTEESERSKLFIASKYLPFPFAGHFFLFRPGVLTALDRSLKNLGRDYLDLYMVHAGMTMHSYSSIVAQMVTAVKSGKVKYVGVSNFSKDQMIQFADLLAKHDIPLSVNQVEYSILRQLPEENGLLEEMRKRKITCLAYSPLAMGRLTGKYSQENPPPSNRRFGGSGLTWDQLAPLLETMKGLAAKYDVSLSAIALNWVISKGAIPLGGARNGKQAAENAKALTFSLTAEETADLSAKGFSGSTVPFEG